MRIAVGQMIQTHQLQQRRHALVDLVLGNTGQLQRQGHVVIHGAGRQQVEVLKHHADVAARCAQLGVGQLHEVASVDDDLAVRGAVEQIQAAHQRAFARAGAADDAEHLARSDFQIDATQGVHRALGALVCQG